MANITATYLNDLRKKTLEEQDNIIKKAKKYFKDLFKDNYDGYSLNIIASARILNDPITVLIVFKLTPQKDDESVSFYISGSEDDNGHFKIKLNQYILNNIELQKNSIYEAIFKLMLSVYQHIDGIENFFKSLDMTTIINYRKAVYEKLDEDAKDKRREETHTTNSLDVGTIHADEPINEKTNTTYAYTINKVTSKRVYATIVEVTPKTNYSNYQNGQFTESHKGITIVKKTGFIDKELLIKYSLNNIAVNDAFKGINYLECKFEETDETPKEVLNRALNI